MEIKKWLEQFPSSQELAKLYQELREKHPPLKSFSIPQQLIEFLYTREPANFKTQDEILLSLIKECRLIEEPSILVMYLFILLYPFIEIPFCYCKKYLWKYQIQDEELWSETWAAFLKVLNEFDLERRHNKIGLFFQSKIGNHLEKFYRRVARQKETEVSYLDELELPEHHLFPKRKTELSKEEILEMEQILEQLINEKVIDSTDKYLIVENKLLKKPIREIAEKLGLPYQTLKKKTYRAKNKIIKVLRERIKHLRKNDF